MTAQEILKSLENIDLNSRQSLEDFSYKFYDWLWDSVPDWQLISQQRILIVPVEYRDLTHSDALVFLFSRDALKSIRPGEWQFEHINCEDRGVYVAWLYSEQFEKGIGDKGCATEELAELHAIIQAIEYQRTQEDKNDI